MRKCKEDASIENWSHSKLVAFKTGRIQNWSHSKLAPTENWRSLTLTLAPTNMKTGTR
jgi:hypothetical protein